MGVDLSTWHPGLVVAMVAIVGSLTTAVLITTCSVGLVQWRKLRSLREMQDFVQELIQQGYTTEEIEQLSTAFFEKTPDKGFAARTLKARAR